MFYLQKYLLQDRCELLIRLYGVAIVKKNNLEEKKIVQFCVCLNHSYNFWLLFEILEPRRMKQYFWKQFFT